MNRAERQAATRVVCLCGAVVKDRNGPLTPHRTGCSEHPAAQVTKWLRQVRAEAGGHLEAIGPPSSANAWARWVRPALRMIETATERALTSLHEGPQPAAPTTAVMLMCCVKCGAKIPESMVLAFGRNLCRYGCSGEVSR